MSTALLPLDSMAALARFLFAAVRGRGVRAVTLAPDGCAKSGPVRPCARSRRP